jgi:class I fructose-bisphosphate aldolase
MSTKNIQKILKNYSSDNKKTLANLERLLNAGKLGGTGKLLILPVDQGFEHGPDASFAVNPPAYDPEYYFKLAIKGGCSAYAAPLGFLEAGAKEYAKKIPLILKLNNSDSLFKSNNPAPAVTATVDDAIRLGCVGIGFTIYPGSSQSKKIYEQLQAIEQEAKAKGLVVIVWSYPRGENLSKEGETAIDVVSYASHIACQLGAHIIKVKLPTAHIDKEENRRIYAMAKIHINNLADRVNHVVQTAFDGKRILIFSGGASKNDKELYEEIKAIKAGGGFGSIIGRNAFQRAEKEALKMMGEIIRIYKK